MDRIARNVSITVSKVIEHVDHRVVFTEIAERIEPRTPQGYARTTDGRDFVSEFYKTLGSRKAGSVFRKLIREAESSGKRLVIELRANNPVRAAQG